MADDASLLAKPVAAAATPPPAVPVDDADMDLQRMGRVVKRMLRKNACVLLAGVVAIVAIVLVSAFWKEGLAWYQLGGSEPPTIHAMTKRLPNGPCISVTHEEMLAGKTGLGTNLRNVRASLEHHIRYSGKQGARLQGICAQHLDIDFPPCFCIVNLGNEADGSDEDTVDMFNMRIIGYSDLVAPRVETPPFCERKIIMNRFEGVTAQWMADSPVELRRTRDVMGLAAYLIQQLDSAQTNTISCQDTNTDKAINQILTRLDQESMFVRGDPFLIKRQMAQISSMPYTGDPNKRQDQLPAYPHGN